MNAWSNIENSTGDPEITRINNLEKKLGKLPDNVKKVRELITRFEVCHFKYQQHLEKIKDSITGLKPKIDTDRIGINHIKNGENVLNTDTTGRSHTGQQYVWAIKAWLGDIDTTGIPDKYDKKSGERIHEWLGNKNPDKKRLTRLLLARLTWDWQSYEKLIRDDELKELELQVCKMDICHYAFPGNLEKLLKGIGQLKAVDENEFEGCGSYNSDIRFWLKKEFLDVNENLKSLADNKTNNKDDLIRIWLLACLAKTIKENINIPMQVFNLEI